MTADATHIEIPLDPETKGMLVFRGLSQSEVDRLIETFKEWLKTDRPFLWIALPDCDTDIKFVRVDKGE